MDNFNLENISIGGQDVVEASKEEVSTSLLSEEVKGKPRPPKTNEIFYKDCEEVKTCHLNDVVLTDQGRILNLSLTIRNVCRGKRVALAVALYEVGSCGKEYSRGTKVMTIPAHYKSCCKDIDVPCMRFVFPEDISVGSGNSMCTATRHFIARVDAHYIDSDSGTCCATALPCTCEIQ